MDALGNEDTSIVIGTLEGDLQVKTEKIGETVLGGGEQALLTLDLESQKSTELGTIIFELSGTANEEQLDGFTLYHGSEPIAFSHLADEKLSFDLEGLFIRGPLELELRVLVKEEQDNSEPLNVFLELVEISIPSKSVTYETGKVGFYLYEFPEDIVIDGIFGDWRNPKEDTIGEVANSNVDITHYDTVSQVEQSFFYLRVDGEILAGVDVPATRAIQTPNNQNRGTDNSPPVATQEEKPLPVKTGEDTIYIFLDTIPHNGYENMHIEFGADHLIEIRGQNGVIRSSVIKEFVGEESDDWDWKYITEADAVSAKKEIEASIDMEPTNVYFHIMDWSFTELEKNRIRIGHDDWASLGSGEEEGEFDERTRGDTYEELTTDIQQDEFVELTTDASDYDTNNAIDIRDIEWKDDSTYYYIRIYCDATVTPTTDTYAIFINWADDGDYDRGYDNYDNSGTLYLEGYTWDGSKWSWAGVASSAARRISYAGNTITYALHKTNSNELDSHTDFYVTVATEDSDDRALYESTRRDPSTGDWEDYSSRTQLDDTGYVDEVDITKVEWKEGDTYIWIRATYKANVDLTSNEYALFVDFDTGATRTYDLAFDIDYLSFGGDHYYLHSYRWNTGTTQWDRELRDEVTLATDSDRFQSSGSTIEFTILKEGNNDDGYKELDGDRNFYIQLGTKAETDEYLDSSPGNTFNDPSSLKSLWHDWLDTAGDQNDPGGTDPNPQTIPEFTTIVFPVFAVFCLFILHRRKKKHSNLDTVPHPEEVIS